MAHPLNTGESARKAPRQKQSRWAAWIIGALFLCVGLVASGWIAYELWTWTEMRGWVPTPATVHSVNFESRRQDQPRRHVGHTTHKTSARYTYRYDGRQYQGTRVAIYTGRDNIGSYQWNRAAELRKLVNKPDAAICYVNPEAPAEATLYRDLRLGFLAFKLLFAIPFTLIGLLFLYGAWNAKKKAI